MRTIIAIFLLCAVVSASAQDKNVSIFNTTNLTRNIAALSDLVRTDINKVSIAIAGDDVENILYTIASAAQDAPKVQLLALEVLDNVNVLLKEFLDNGRNLTDSQVLQNILRNYVRLEKDIDGVISGFSSRNFKDAGLNLADLLQIILFGNTSHPIKEQRLVRQLSEAGAFVDTISILKGFFKKANTTVESNVFETLINDFTYFNTLVNNVKQSFDDKNASAVISSVAAILQHVLIVQRDTSAFRDQLAQWIVRDRPYYAEPIKVVLAVNSLLENWEITEPKFNEIVDSFADEDFEDTGVAVGDLYNDIYTFLTQ